MGLFHRGKNKNPAPDRAAAPDPAWRPDLTAYRKAMLLHGITFDDIHGLLKEYAQLASDKKPVGCDFFYTAVPDGPAWIYLEFPNFENVSPSLNFWHYQNLLVWLSQKTDREFCLAIPRDQTNPLFLSTMDRQNPYGDSCRGVYADRDFYFEIPGETLQWGPVPTSPFNYMGFLKEAFQFDTRWIPKVSQCQWRKTQVTLMFPE